VALSVRDKQGEAARQIAKIGPAERIAAFLAAGPSPGDERRELAVAFAVRRKRHKFRSIPQLYFRADDERHADALRRYVRPRRSRERALVGERERPVAERRSALHQLLGMRGAAQESEIGDAMQLGVGGEGRIHLRRTSRAGTSRRRAPGRSTP